MDTIELVFIILNAAYVMGMLWIVTCEAIEDMILGVSYHQMQDLETYEDNFLVQFGLIDNTIKENVIISMYFAFTTLSTVGFGDFYPVSDSERAVGAMVLFVGVLVFSYIMGYFIEQFDSFLRLQEDFDDGYELQKFFLYIWAFN